MRLELPEPCPVVAADPDRLQQILTNLLSNAVKYSAPASEIVVAATPRSRLVDVSVTNTAGEIGGEIGERIFSRFYREPGAAAAAPGLGIGLYVVKGLVEAHGGDVRVDSKDGRTTFRFTLPLPPVAKSSAAAAQTRSAGAAAPP